MTQPLWYVRKHGSVTGPFPTPQIKEMLKLGDMVPGDLVSLDGRQWMSIAQSGQFLPEPRKPVAADAIADAEWRHEREKARARWTGDIEPWPVGDLPGLSQDARRAAALAQDHENTRHLVEEQAARKPPLIMAGIALLVVIGIGIAIWHGEGDDTLRTAFEKVSNCGQPAGPGISWAGCPRAGANLRGASLRNADLSRGNFDGAELSLADLDYADLRRASLRGANMRSVKLVGAVLDAADLTGADLRGADLRYASFKGAILEGVRLDGAALGKAIWQDGKLCAETSLGTCH